MLTTGQRRRRMGLRPERNWNSRRARREPVGGDERCKPWARRRGLRHGVRSRLGFAASNSRRAADATIGGAGLAIEDLFRARAHGFGSGTVAEQIDERPGQFFFGGDAQGVVREQIVQ